MYLDVHRTVEQDFSQRWREMVLKLVMVHVRSTIQPLGLGRSDPCLISLFGD